MSFQFLFGPASGGEPLPVISIILTDAGGQTTPPLLAVVDTGADGTLVPREVLRQAGFKPSRQRRKLLSPGYALESETVIGYALALRIGSLELPEIEVYSSRKMSEVILGRNVLNQFVFTYDGPRRILDIVVS
jgi:hypothetical protein